MRSPLFVLGITALAVAALACGPGAERAAPPSDVETTHAPAGGPEPPVAIEPEPVPEPAHPPLDRLLRLPADAASGEAPGVEWAGEREVEEATGETRKPRVRVDYSREDVTEGVPMQTERRQTDVGVSVPVDEADRLRIKGGVRVDERELSETEREADTTPTVGVELKF